MLWITFKNIHRAELLSAFQKSDLVAILLKLKYVNGIFKHAPSDTKERVSQRLPYSLCHDAILSTSQDTTVDITNSINKLAESVVDLICKTTAATLPKTPVKSFHNQTPRITRTILDSINAHTSL